MMFSTGFGRQVMMLDREMALERVGGDQTLLQEVAQIFLDDADRAMREIKEAIACGDAKRLEHEAHSLKGSVANFGASPVVQAALDLEIMGRRGNLNAALAGLLSLETNLNALRPELVELAAH